MRKEVRLNYLQYIMIFESIHSTSSGKVNIRCEG